MMHDEDEVKEIEVGLASFSKVMDELSRVIKDDVPCVINWIDKNMDIRKRISFTCQEKEEMIDTEGKRWVRVYD